MRVNEIFQSIQGEGPGSGRRACFVRFSGCNLVCNWCDSKYALTTHIEVTREQVLNAVLATKCRYVVLTGGEPLVQPSIFELIADLVAAGIEVDVETNGTIIPEPTEGGYEGLARYIVSPKNTYEKTIDEWTRGGLRHVFKFVVDEYDCEDVIQMCKNEHVDGAWFMPRTDLKQVYGVQMAEMARMGRLITDLMIHNKYDGYVCTRLQNFYRVR